MTQVGAIDAASREIGLHLEHARQRELECERLESLVRMTDAIVDELERLNLDQVERVNGDWKRRLAHLFSALPFPYSPWLRAHPSPTEVLGVLFDVQGRLLLLRRARSTPSAAPVRPPRWLARARRER